jgi:hypothetical protein
MDADETLQRIRRILELARDCVKRAEAHQALGYLDSIHDDVEERPQSPEWAEHTLIYAGALAALAPRGDRTAEAVYEDAVKRVYQVPSAPPMLLIRTHEDYAKYLVGHQAWSRAAHHNQKARDVAQSADYGEDIPRLELRGIRIALERNDSPILPDFRNLRKAGREYGYRDLEQLEAWISHKVTLDRHSENLGGARGRGRGQVASVEYWRGKLSEVRRKLHEPVH